MDVGKKEKERAGVCVWRQRREQEQLLLAAPLASTPPPATPRLFRESPPRHISPISMWHSISPLYRAYPITPLQYTPYSSTPTHQIPISGRIPSPATVHYSPIYSFIDRLTTFKQFPLLQLLCLITPISTTAQHTTHYNYP